jgi:hypothetical protein
LAKAGYWQGDPQRILAAPTDIVMAAVEYEKFVGSFEEAFIELNREQ